MNTPFSKGLISGTISKLVEIRRSSSTGEEDKEKTSFCISVLHLMHASDDVWNVQCPYSYKKIGDSFNDMLFSMSGSSIDFDDKFFISCYWFLVEASFYFERIGRNDLEIESLVLSVNDISVHEDYELHMSYVKSNKFKIDILNYYIGKKDFQAFLTYEEHVEKVKEQIENSWGEVNEAKKEASRIADILKEQKITGTFVRLEKGFFELLSKNNRAKWLTFVSLLCISILIVAIPVISSGLLSHFSILQEIRNNIFSPIGTLPAWGIFIPLIGVELILIYFFRIVLKHYYTIQTQIMQLSFRYSLCQFIGAYLEYSKEIKENNKNALDKFESLIFSNLVSDANNIPSTFDGLDNLASFVKNIKNVD